MLRKPTVPELASHVLARKRWGLVAGFVAAALFPIVLGVTGEEPTWWAWTVFFALNALLAAFTDLYF